MRHGWLVLLCVVTLPAHAQTKLIKVLDGDTVIVQTQQQTLHVRLLDIDAPELHQTYGKQARRSLQQWCRPPVQLTTHGHDLYGRTLGHLYCRGEDASQYMVATGAAWFNRRYSKRNELDALEQAARARQQGLWQQANPMPPWEWRKRYSKNYRPQ